MPPPIGKVRIPLGQTFRIPHGLTTGCFIPLTGLLQYGIGRTAYPPYNIGVKQITVGDRLLGDNCAPLIVAEIGINHNGDIDLAKRMIESAALCGAEMIKLQSFQPEKFLDPALPYYDHIKKLSFSFKEQEELFKFAKTALEPGKAMLFSAPFDNETADFLESMDVPAYKIASMDCNNLPLLRHVAKKGKPIFLATGMADMDEVASAVSAIRGCGNEQIVLMHCVSDYPTKVSDINLRAMVKLSEAFQLPVGFSDHSTGLEAAFTAAVLGAVIIEKHFTPDRKMKEEFPFSDHAISIEPDELQKLAGYCKNLPIMLGSPEKRLSQNEKENRDSFRRGIYATRDLEKGTVIAQSDCIPLRPLQGVSVAEWDSVIGKRLSRPLKKGEPLKISYLE